MLILPYIANFIPNDPYYILGLTKFQIQQNVTPFDCSGNSAHILNVFNGNQM